MAVSGASMAPKYRNGDWLLVRWGGGFYVDHIVVIERESYPGIFYIKRVKSIKGNEVWVEGDNRQSSEDSHKWGAISPEEIVGKVLFRYRKGKTLSE
ncbi:MAG: S26 family signal peptidase [Actinobacteria bacterium]|nr:S26 family signal peptidase [Actinomycetota bacterium]MSX24992.1 S26 family signal peptidase [Actinomycetota bacterium]MSY46605.1 S26 family signal peptidase [Actinomycetota bacterium]MSY57360.1 S26 family signal peptidase [Actinomycetota bacterium]MTB00921.1 S26 family signal peptidase [Actinomycetota bacterium]